MDQSDWIQQNKAEYSGTYDRMNWVTKDRAIEAARERETILGSLENRITLGFNGTKPHFGDLSPGCRICGNGDWSCLFITGMCNRRCFYCPAEQTTKGEPNSNGISFHSPKEYVAYLKKFGYKGVAISGGEPFIALDKSLKYLSAIRESFGQDIYLWLYTNGSMVTQKSLRELAQSGLDEIRFDISAIRYDMDKVSEAVKIIDRITVEIPAIPEDFDFLKSIMGKLQETGVRFLNLRQLRATPYNAGKLMERGYMFAHGPKVTVPESELTALRLMQYALESGLTIPINYCSYAFRERFQGAGLRRRLAPFVIKPYEDITPSGYIRRMSVKRNPDDLAHFDQALRSSGNGKAQWKITERKDRIFINQQSFNQLNFKDEAIVIDYFMPVLLPSVSYRNDFKEIPLDKKRTVFIERVSINDPNPLNELEEIKTGLQEYF